MPRIRADRAACAICMESLFSSLDDLDQLIPATAPDCGKSSSSVSYALRKDGEACAQLIPKVTSFMNPAYKNGSAPSRYNTSPKLANTAWIEIHPHRYRMLQLSARPVEPNAMPIQKVVNPLCIVCSSTLAMKEEAVVKLDRALCVPLLRAGEKMRRSWV